MFKRLKLIYENSKLKEENKKIKEENELNREDIENFALQRYKAKILAEDTIKQLNLLQEIEHKGYSEEDKKKNRNIIINNLRKQNIDIIKELSRNFEAHR